jgi:hypothetical protein
MKERGGGGGREGREERGKESKKEARREGEREERRERKKNILDIKMDWHTKSRCAVILKLVVLFQL